MKVAITGGICSGKSTICDILKRKGYFVFNSDNEAKLLANTTPQIKSEIISLFGSDSYINDEYNTQYIRNIVFNDKEKLELLNKCFSGFVLEKYNIDSQAHKISFFESALVFEHNIQDNFDFIIGVYCDEFESIKRLKQRNGFNDLEIDNIIKNQLNTKEKMFRCDSISNTTSWIDVEEIDSLLEYIQTKI